MRRQNSKPIHSFLSKPVLGWVVGFVVCALLLSTQFRTYVYEMNSVFIGLMLITVPNVILKEKKIIQFPLISEVGAILHQEFAYVLMLFVFGLEHKDDQSLLCTLPIADDLSLYQSSDRIAVRSCTGINDDTRSPACHELGNVSCRTLHFRCGNTSRLKYYRW
jgi:hypothetical protein